MKRIFSLLLVILLPLIFVFPTVAQEVKKENFVNDEVVTLAKSEVVNRDFFAFGERVEISGTVNGDVYAAGGIVIVDGTVNGDLIVAGGTLNISGNVSQDVRAAGGQVTISGQIGKNLTVGGGNVEVTGSAKIGGSLVSGSGNITVSALVAKDVRIGAGNLTITNTVGGNADVAIGQLRLTSGAKIGGDLTYWSDSDASIDGLAVVKGDTVKNQPSQVKGPKASEAVAALTGVNFFFALISFVTTLVIGFLLIKLVPKFTSTATENLRKKPWPSLGVGILALVVLPIIGIALLITIVGIPLAILLFVIYGIGLYIARIPVLLVFGQIVGETFNRKINPYLAFFVGSLVYSILAWIPILGWLLGLFAALFGLGAILLTKKQIYQAARKQNLI